MGDSEADEKRYGLLDTSATVEQSYFFTQPSYKCPIHGESTHAIHVQGVRQDLDGSYCMICAVEKMVGFEIQKVERVK